MLAGITVSGVLMGIFQSNAGGAWDNAKKSFEKGVEINGKIEKKGSDAHKAAVTGDTVGDPFKDTSGPSMNILIKLTSIVSLIIAPFIANWYLLKDEVVVEEAPVAVIEEVVVEEAAAAVEEATIELEEAAAQVVDEK
jgi:K(+)-stimulated pyrophosphate-energized sodium pump